MANTKLRLSLAIVVAMSVLAGCSSNKSADSGNNAGANGYNTGSSTGAYGDGSANGNGSDYAQNGRTVYFDFDRFTMSAEGQATVDRNAGSPGRSRRRARHSRIQPRPGRAPRQRGGPVPRGKRCREKPHRNHQLR
jgi:hypothetical protein